MQSMCLSLSHTLKFGLHADSTCRFIPLRTYIVLPPFFVVFLFEITASDIAGEIDMVSFSLNCLPTSKTL